MKHGGKLKNWCIIGNILYGDIYLDKRFNDGDPIRTTPIKKVIVETKNTVYELDPVNQVYGKRYQGKEAV